MWGYEFKPMPPRRLGTRISESWEAMRLIPTPLSGMSSWEAAVPLQSRLLVHVLCNGMHAEHRLYLNPLISSLEALRREVLNA